MEATTEKMVTVARMGQILGLEPVKVNQAALRGKIKRELRTDGWYYDVESAKAWLSGSTTGAAKPQAPDAKERRKAVVAQLAASRSKKRSPAARPQKAAPRPRRASAEGSSKAPPVSLVLDCVQHGLLTPAQALNALARSVGRGEVC